MEQQIDILMQIAQNLGLQGVINQLTAIKQRSLQPNADLILPLVGEFSSGKTTLLNALTDSKQLETATKPTTATIYEVHFGCERCEAKVVTEDGNCISVRDISELKNDKLADAQVVTVSDTSTKVPSTTVLVDTPGLSSPDPKHRQTLVDFLPQADAILLVSDINQQVTRSLTDFIDTIKLSKRPIYMVLTKSDTKSASEIVAAKKYIEANCKIPVEQIVVTSAAKDEMTELYSLLDNIQKSKKEILQKVDGQRLKDIAKIMLAQIDELLSASTSDDNLDLEVRKQQLALDKIKRNISKLIESMANDVSECGTIVSRQFEDSIYAKLSALVAGKSANFNNDALSLINNTASLLLSNYKEAILGVVSKKIQESQGSENEISLDALAMLDLSNVQITSLSYDLDLDSMGHEYDKSIKNGILIAAAAAAVAVTAGMAAPAAGAAAGTAAGSTVAAGTAAGSTVAAGAAAGGTAVGGAAAASVAVNAADTITDVGSIIYTRKMLKRINQAREFAGKATEQYEKMEQKADSKGFMTSVVGFVTDKLLSKPQRVRAVRVYVENTLAPEFRSQLNSASENIVGMIRKGLQTAAVDTINQKTTVLNQLRQQRAEKKEEFARKIEMFREYKNQLLKI